MTPGLAPAALAALVDAVGADHVLTDAEVTAGHVVDWTGRFRGATPAVVRPRTHDEVAAVVAVARAHQLAIVPQGGNTGLVGGSVPLAGEVVLSTARLAGVLAVDAASGHLTAAAGTPLARVQDAARAAGWAYGVDLAARDSATIGGNVATNAGGLRVVAHGPTRAQLVGVAAVLGTGATVDDLGRLEKDVTGYDLSGLLCGSEGTLGVITAVRLRLVPARPERVVVALGFGSMAGAVEAVGRLRRALPDLEAAEAYGAAEADLVAGHLGSVPVVDAPVTVVVEVAASTDPTDGVAEAVGALDGVLEVHVAADGPRRAALWRPRETITEAIATVGPHHKLDVSLPADELGDFAVEVERRVGEAVPGARTWIFGHLGDGNLHVNVTGVEPDDATVDDVVLGLVLERRGSISAEHGIGTAKRAWLGRQRGDDALATMRAIRAACDPDGILNPAVLL